MFVPTPSPRPTHPSSFSKVKLRLLCCLPGSVWFSLFSLWWWKIEPILLLTVRAHLCVRLSLPLTIEKRVVELLLKRFWQVLTTFFTCSGVSDKVILIESISISRNYIFWHVWKIDFFMFIVKAKFCWRYMTVFWLMWASCTAWLKINISSKYINTLVY